MDQITKYIEELLAYTTLSGGWLSFVTMFALCAVTALVAWLVYMLCIKIVTPLLVRITKHTDMIWDDYLLNPQVLHSACHVVPAIVVWQMLPPLFIANPVIQTLDRIIQALRLRKGSSHGSTTILPLILWRA